jgi:signal transduction histidine kinase
MAQARRGTSIRARLFLTVGVPVAVLVLGLGGFAWRGARIAVGEAIEKEMASIVEVSATTVNPSLARHLLDPRDVETRTYKNLVDKLSRVQRATGSSRVLLIGADEKVRADARGELPLFGPAPRLALDRAELGRALAGEVAVSVPFEDEQGNRYLAAYARVPERRAPAEAAEEPLPMVLVIEAPASLLDLTDRVATWLIAGCLVAVLLVFVFAALVARTITGPLLRLADEAESLGRGRLGHALWVPPGTDEVALLGRTLEDMREALEDRDQDRQMMLAGIAHEVRNPLGGMELFSGLLEEQLAELPEAPEGDSHWLPADLKEDLTSHAARVRKELRYLTGVVNDFLAFARDLPVQREPVDVRALIADVLSLRDGGPGPAPAVSCDVEAPFPLDRGRIKEALLNLVANAQQATPDDGEIAVSARVDEEDRLVLAIKDSGAGMKADDVARAFQPFYTTKEKGSGLGLPLVRKFARDHGGDASIESAPGEGTTVKLVLARAPLPPQPDESEPTEPNAPPWGTDESEPVLLGDG